MNKKIKIIRIVCFLITSVTLLGCNAKELSNSSKKPDVESELINSLKTKYENKEKYNFSSDIKNIKRDESIEINVPDMDYDKGYYDSIKIFEDSTFSQEASYMDVDYENGKIIFEPGYGGLFSILNVNLSDETSKKYGKEDSSTLFEKESDWGNNPKYYMVQYKDLETLEDLDKPIVTTISVAGELSTPEINYLQSSDGTCTFTWNTIEGAEKYIIFSCNYDNEFGSYGSCVPIDETSETSWSLKNDGDEYANQEYRIYDYLAEEDPQKAIPIDEDYLDTYYGVIAINEEGNSMISNLISIKDIASFLPNHISSYDNKYLVESFDELPSYDWVVMCDGKMKQKFRNYDIEHAQIKTYEYIDLNEKK